jgi:hypothetical protein
MSRVDAIRFCSLAVGCAGALWCVKASAIILTGDQPSLTFELGQLMFPIGAIGLYLTCDVPRRAEKSGLILAIVGLAGSLLALLYPLLPGARVSTGEEFLFPYSFFVLIGSLGGFMALLVLGFAILRRGGAWGPWRRLPAIVATLPLLLLPSGALNFELPILLIGVSWIVLGFGLWRAATVVALTPEPELVARS